MAGMEIITVLIVDDHQVVRQGLRTFLNLHVDIRVIGEAGDGLQAVEQVRELRPDVVLMDLVMPVQDGVEATRQIRAFDPAIKVIALTSFSEDSRVFPAIQAGVCGFLLKDVSPDDLVEAIRAAQRGEVRLHPQITQKLMEQVIHQADSKPKPDRLIESLTDREREIVCLVAKGQSNQVIAQTLVISEKTVKTHISNILSKLDLADRTQLAIFAIQNGLVEAG